MTLRRGRPSRQDPPSIAGIYRYQRPDGHTYIGQTHNLKQRKRQHQQAGHLPPGTTFEWIPANPNTTTDDLRNAERRHINRHQPTLNQRKGGAGRPTKP